MRIKTSGMVAAILLVILAFSFPGVSRSQGFQFDEAKPAIYAGKQAADSENGNGEKALKSFAMRIAGTYLAIREPDAGPSRILTIHADGNLSSIQSIQFGGGAAGGGFSDQQGMWKRLGRLSVQATVLDFSFQPGSGEFLGTAAATYNLQFDGKFQKVTGAVAGKVFAPGVNPLNPGNAAPIAEFTDAFQAQKITIK